MKSRPVFLRTLRLRNAPTAALLARPSLLSSPTLTAPSPIPSFRALSTSSRRLNETKQQEQQQKGAESGAHSKKPPPKQEDNAPPQSPWKVFVNTLKEEIEKNQGWQDNVKQLQGEVDKAADSEAMKRARILYEKTRVSLVRAACGIGHWLFFVGAIGGEGVKAPEEWGTLIHHDLPPAIYQLDRTAADARSPR